MERKVEKKLPAELLAILACPHCKGELIYDEKDNSLICEKCKVKSELKFCRTNNLQVVLYLLTLAHLRHL